MVTADKNPVRIATSSGNQSSLSQKLLSWKSSFIAALAAFILVNLITLSSGGEQQKKLTLAALGDLSAARQTGRPASWWVAHAYLERTAPPDILLLGSSQLGGLCAADADLVNEPMDYVEYHGCYSLEDQLKQANNLTAHCFAAGMVGSMVSDHYVMTKCLFAAAGSPKIVILALSPRDFIDSSLPNVSATEPFRFFAPYIDISPIQSDAFSNLVDCVSWFANRSIPLRNVAGANQQNLATQATPEPPSAPKPSLPHEPPQSKKRMKQDPLLVMKAQSMYVLRPGDCMVYPHIPDMFVDNTGDYLGRYSRAGSPMFATQMRFLKRVIAELRATGVQVALIGMPLDHSNRILLPENFWLSYRSQLSNICAQNTATYADFSDDPAFTHTDFVDGVHMNARGGKKLAEKIAQVIIHSPFLVNSLSINSISPREIATE